MGKVVADSVLDAALDAIGAATEIYLCTSEPANRAAADTASVIPAHTMTTGDFTNGNGDTNGRKTTVAAQNGLTADANGTVTHVALSTGTTLLYVTTCTSQAVTSGNTVNIGAWDVEIADPT
jgi:hypothetical protein